MTKQELTAAVALAQSDAALDYDILPIFDGFGLADFAPVSCTPYALAALVRWQCVQFNGHIDAIALQEIATLGKRRFVVIG